MAKITVPSEYTYLGWRKLLDGADEKRIGHNTYARIVHVGTGGLFGVAIRLHNTDVVTYWENGSIVLYSGGYLTTTTKQRMNACLPQRFRVFARDFVWYVRDAQDGSEQMYEDDLRLFYGFGG